MSGGFKLCPAAVFCFGGRQDKILYRQPHENGSEGTSKGILFKRGIFKSNTRKLLIPFGNKAWKRWDLRAERESQNGS